MSNRCNIPQCNLDSQFTLAVQRYLRHCLRLDIKTAIKAIKTDVLDYCI